MITAACQTRQFLKRSVVGSMMLSIVFTGHLSEAARAHCGKYDQKSGSGVLASTSYYVPRFKSMNEKAKAAMKLQGSAIVGDKVYKYGGKKPTSTSSCPQVFGDATVKGAANRCLIPFVSVAASSKVYPMGTIIDVPELKGKTFKLPNGTNFKHPGFLIVQDVGGDIKGNGRFDLYTGTSNPFKTDFYKKFGMTDRMDCKYAFSTIPSESKSGDYNPKWASAQQAIQQSLLSAGDTKMAKYMGEMYPTPGGQSAVAAVQ